MMKNTGSYPKPPSPMGAKAMVPGHSPRAESTSPLGKQQVMTDTNLAVRGVCPRMFSSSRR